MKKHFQPIKMDDSGFTLIEIMVVVVIIGILVGAVALNFRTAPDQARWNKTKAAVVTLESAVELYKLDNSRYPTTEQGLQALVEEPQTEPAPKKWRKGGYLQKGKVPNDPWDNEYLYLCPGVHDDFDIFSFGADGVAGGEDYDQDINNWEIE
jgi:general secretion pathway protein G